MKLYIESNKYEQIEPGEVHLHIKFRPANMVGVVLMLLLHGFLLYYLLHLKHEKTKQGDVEQPQSPIVLLFEKKVAETKASKPETKKSEPPPKSITQPIAKERKTAPPVLLTDERRDLPPPPVEPAPPELDMTAMINAAREKRKLAEAAAAQENQTAQQGNRGLSAQEAAEANVKRSLQLASGRAGTNGVFTILSKSTRTGSFAFRGWTPGAGNSWRQVIEVDAGLGGDVELALVRRMIELIRTHYTGDFSWESRRLGRVINLSARPKDTAELENFMMKEFFGGNG